MAIYKDIEEITVDAIVSCMKVHISNVERYKMLSKYYDGDHKILGRTFDNPKIPNNKLVCNHAEYITDMATNYVFGNPVSYAGDGAGQLNELFTLIDEDSHNSELALDMSVFGLGHELIYMNEEQTPYPELAVMSPLNTFVVCDTSVKHKPIFAVTYRSKKENNKEIYIVDVYTKDEVITYETDGLTNKNYKTQGTVAHYFKDVPVIEYKNNKRLRGDFEGVITLIDAYNKLQSDRINDKEQLVDAFLVLIGQSLGDTKEEMTETVKFLTENKIIELDKDGDARWLVKQLDENQTEILKDAVKKDIHAFSKVPNLTDDNFIGNSSGVAIKYKLIAFEQLGKSKERYFKQGLRKRLKLISNIERIRANMIDVSDVNITMKRSLPIDEEMLARIAMDTDGFLSHETRLQRFDEEIDASEELSKLDAEKEKAIERQKAAMGYDDTQNNDDSNQDGIEDEE